MLGELQKVKVGVIDIGSPKKDNVGWAIVNGSDCCDAGTCLDRCIERLAEVLRKEPLALGFEAPMFVPMRCKAMTLTEARDGDGGRPFSAGAGATTLVCATVVVPYVLRRLRKAVPSASATLNWRKWQRQEGESGQLLLFEAFVSGKAKTKDGTHEKDAEAAARALCDKLKDYRCVESMVTVGRSFNILGAMMLRTGWASSCRVLCASCLVVKPDPEKPAALG